MDPHMQLKALTYVRIALVMMVMLLGISWIMWPRWTMHSFAQKVSDGQFERANEFLTMPDTWVVIQQSGQDVVKLQCDAETGYEHADEWWRTKFTRTNLWGAKRTLGQVLEGRQMFVFDYGEGIGPYWFVVKHGTIDVQFDDGQDY